MRFYRSHVIRFTSTALEYFGSSYTLRNNIVREWGNEKIKKTIQKTDGIWQHLYMKEDCLIDTLKSRKSKEERRMIDCDALNFFVTESSACKY